MDYSGVFRRGQRKQGELYSAYLAPSRDADPTDGDMQDSPREIATELIPA